MFYFSKSKYCDFKQCPKIPWLKKYRPEEYVVDAATQARFTEGNEVGDLAMGLFGDFIEVTSLRADGSLDLGKMKRLTAQYIAEGREVICEAAFEHNGLYCAVDILKKNDDKYDIFEVKSSTSPDHPVYLLDTAYQRYVLEKCGVKVGKVCLVTVDNSYVFDGTLDLKKLFRITDVTELVGSRLSDVEGDLAAAEKVMRSFNEPPIGISEACNSPYMCPFFDYCTRNLPSPSVFDLYDFGYKKKLALYRRGVVSFEDVLRDGSGIDSEIRRRQVELTLSKEGPYIDREEIAEFLKTLTYPLYFLDFETVQPAVPRYIGTRPYSQIPVQYSLHILEENGTLRHLEFLGRPEEDPRRRLAERLISDIPEGVCVVAYNSAFERGRIRELAEAFPDLKDRLLGIAEHVKDLLDPFRKGYYYDSKMGGSFSIKSVLPAIYPNDPSLDYHSLEGVHNGEEAMTMFLRLPQFQGDARAKAEQDLLRYCELDTFAMVKVHAALIRSVRSS